MLGKYEAAIKTLSEKPSKLTQFAEWTKSWRQIKELLQPLEEEKARQVIRKSTIDFLGRLEREKT